MGPKEPLRIGVHLEAQMEWCLVVLQTHPLSAKSSTFVFKVTI